MFSAANGARSSSVAQLFGLIISNSNSQNLKSTLAEADLTRRAGIDLITVSVGTWVDPKELQGVASYPVSQNSFSITGGYSALSNVVGQITDLACGSEYIHFCLC